MSFHRRSVMALTTSITLTTRSRRARTRQRLSALVGAIDGGNATSFSTRRLLGRTVEYLSDAGSAEMWFALAVLTAEYPLADDVIEAIRVRRLEGAGAVIHTAIDLGGFHRFVPVIAGAFVEVVTDTVIVDVDHTSTVGFATGIQRVVRETVARWARDHEIILVGWTRERSALRRLTEAEQTTALTGVKSDEPTSSVAGTAGEKIVVPMGGLYLLPELTLDRRVALRLASMGETSSTSCAVIGYDAVPLASAETVDFMVSGGFANNLSAVKYMDRVAMISEAAAVEYRGWRSMLSGSGIVGPDITALLLPHEPLTRQDMDLDDAAEKLGLQIGVPLVLCVGSHEPRKNHLAVLHAAEELWREGHLFQLLFVGGNAWSSGLFSAKTAELAESGRMVSNVRALDDELLQAAYRLASFTVFPSLNEGYGLPITESLAAGTPVVTSNFGSMVEITASGGALYVDPRLDSSVKAGMEALLTDPELRERLHQQAAELPSRSWDEYADETWQYLTGL